MKTDIGKSASAGQNVILKCLWLYFLSIGFLIFKIAER
jgi:hypothetical protein